MTGEEGEGSHAHHIFPNAYSNSFGSLGIDNQDPQYGSWWEAHDHVQHAYEYNSWWGAFFTIDGVTASDAFALVDFLAELFGFELNY